MKHLLIFVGISVLASCSTTVSTDVNFIEDASVTALEAVGNFMANGRDNKVVVHADSVSVHPISTKVDPTTAIKIPFKPWCGSPADYELRIYKWRIPTDYYPCEHKGTEAGGFCKTLKQLERKTKPHVERGLLGFSIFSGECDMQHFYYDLIGERFVVWSR